MVQGLGFNVWSLGFMVQGVGSHEYFSPVFRTDLVLHLRKLDTLDEGGVVAQASTNERFRGGLVLKAHRLVYHSPLGCRVMTEEEEERATLPEEQNACMSDPNQPGHDVWVDRAQNSPIS